MPYKKRKLWISAIKGGEGSGKIPNFYFKGSCPINFINFTHDKAIYLLTDNLKRQLFIIYASLMLFYRCHYAAVLALTMQPI